MTLISDSFLDADLNTLFADWALEATYKRVASESQNLLTGELTQITSDETISIIFEEVTKKYIESGFAECDLVCHVMISEFSYEPTRGDVIFQSSDEFRVVRVIKSGCGRKWLIGVRRTK